MLLRSHGRQAAEKMLALLRQNAQYFNKQELLFQITKLGVGREGMTNSATSSGLLYHDYLPFQSCALSSLLHCSTEGGGLGWVTTMGQ